MPIPCVSTCLPWQNLWLNCSPVLTGKRLFKAWTAVSMIHWWDGRERPNRGLEGPKCNYPKILGQKWPRGAMHAQNGEQKPPQPDRPPWGQTWGTQRKMTINPLDKTVQRAFFIARKHLAHNRILSFHPRVQPDSYLDFFTFRPVWGVFSSRTTGFYLFCPRAQPDSILPPSGCNGISRTTGIAVHQWQTPNVQYREEISCKTTNTLCTTHKGDGDIFSLGPKSSVNQSNWSNCTLRFIGKRK